MKKDLYLKKLQAQLDEWNADLDRLKAKADKANADAKIKYENEISSIRDRMSEAREKAGEIQNANEDAWEDLKDGADKAWNSVKEAMDDAKKNFK